MRARFSSSRLSTSSWDRFYKKAIEPRDKRKNFWNEALTSWKLHDRGCSINQVKPLIEMGKYAICLVLYPSMLAAAAETSSWVLSSIRCLRSWKSTQSIRVWWNFWGLKWTYRRFRQMHPGEFNPSGKLTSARIWPEIWRSCSLGLPSPRAMMSLSENRSFCRKNQLLYGIMPYKQNNWDRDISPQQIYHDQLSKNPL